MRIALAAIVASLVVAANAYAQAPTTPAATDSATATAAAPAAAVPVPSNKRFACRTTAQGFQGQERHDHMQLCMAQARTDCLKQAIDQKIVGRERKEFVKSCVD
jgi:hypothetical protein